MVKRMRELLRWEKSSGIHRPPTPPERRLRGGDSTEVNSGIYRKRASQREQIITLLNTWHMAISSRS